MGRAGMDAVPAATERVSARERQGLNTSQDGQPRRYGIVASDPLRFLGLQTMLPPEPDAEFVALTGQATLELRSLSLVLVDASCTPHLLELIAAFRRAEPELKLVVVGLESDSGHIERVIGAGAKGYLTHEAGEKEIRMAIDVVLDGSVWAPRKVLARLIERNRVALNEGAAAPLLTPREGDVLSLLVSGRSNRETGAALGIDEATVKAHVGRLMRKFGVANRTALTVRAMKLGLPTRENPA